MASHTLLLATVYTLCIAGIVNGEDLCKNPNQEALVQRITTSAAPSSGVDAGEYKQIKDAKSFAECVITCCGDLTCNTVFYTKEMCFTIKCKSDEDCKPVVKSALGPSTFLINLRTAAETTSSDTDVSTTNQNLPSAATTPTTHKPTFSKKTCELYLNECAENEECVSTSALKMQGVCECSEEYKRDLVTLECVKPPEVETGSETSSPSLVIPNDKTASTESTATPTELSLIVSAGKDKILQYPENSLTLSAFTIPAASTENVTIESSGETYKYKWSLLGHPEGQAESTGRLEGADTQQIHLSNLVPGVYNLKVDVTGEHKSGVAYVNVTVNPEKIKNQPPVAVIEPAVLNIQEGKIGILDGSGSQDNDKDSLKYFWEVESGPITDQTILDGNTAAMLPLKSLTPGDYTIKLIITDKEGLTNSTSAQVHVEKLVDYPPNANAGDDTVVYLPQKIVILYGNGSTDDKGIVSYEWNSKTDDLPADMVGSRSSILHLANLREGTYTFELTVTDTASQTSTAEVHLIVKPENNNPPIAAVANKVINVSPGSTVQLDGLASAKDQNIESYQWTQVSGPSKAELKNADRSTASLTKLINGDYVFKLKITDSQHLSGEVDVAVHVKDGANGSPVAHAGPDLKLTMPVKFVSLNGNHSSDDNQIVGWLWTRSDDSPAAGQAVDGTDKKSILQLINLVAGTYTYTLTVTDAEALHSIDKVTIQVLPDPLLYNLVELSFNAEIGSFTSKQEKNLATQLTLLLPSPADAAEVVIDIRGVYPDYHSGKLTVVFAVFDHRSATNITVRNGSSVKDQLKEALSKSYRTELIGFKVAQVDTVVCQNACSDHGHCDQFTKKCVCESFWMQNYVKSTWEQESNCDWSILYVVITCLAGIILLASLIWLILCCSRRCKKGRNRRKHTYKLLEDIEQLEDQEKSYKKGKRNNINANGSIFLSETDLSSDEDTLFVNGKTPNSSGPQCNNNLMKQSYDRLKANNLRNKLNT